MRCCKNKNKSSTDKSKDINNKDKNSNKINSKNDNNKNNTKNKYNKSSEFSRSGLNDTISNTSTYNTYNQKEKVFILGDSVVKNVYGFLLTRNLNYKCLIKIRSFPGAYVRCLHNYVKPTMRDFNPNQILNIGTNDLNLEKNI